MPKAEDVLRQIGIGMLQEFKRVGVAAALAGADVAAQRIQGIARELDTRAGLVRERASWKIAEILRDMRVDDPADDADDEDR